MNQDFPKISIIDTNTLAAIGLKQLLQNAVPMITVDTFSSMSDLMENNPEQYIHYFVSLNILLESRAFFIENRRKTIVLSLSFEKNNNFSDFHSICIDVSEKELIRQLLMLLQHGHSNGRNMPSLPESFKQKILSNREIEVMSLIVQGFINKEIADKLNIGLATVVTHRRNIMDKLGLKSVSSLTIYAVTHGYVDINKI